MMLSASFSRGGEKFDIEFKINHHPSQLGNMSGVHNKDGRRGEGPRIDDLHVPCGPDDCLELNLDRIRFWAFARAKIFSGFDKVWPFVMMCNMV